MTNQPLQRNGAMIINGSSGRQLSRESRGQAKYAGGRADSCEHTINNTNTLTFINQLLNPDVNRTFHVDKRDQIYGTQDHRTGVLTRTGARTLYSG